MEPLLPETAEGGDACAGSDEDARTGAVLGKLEAAGTEGTEGKRSCPQRLWVQCTHTGQGHRNWGVVETAVLRGGGLQWRQRAQI